jgi:hypothetical protein
VSKRQHDQDDWSADSASLFRDVRRALDAKSLERAPIEAVLARIQAAGHEASSAAVRAPVAGTWLGQAAKGLLAVALLGAASFGAFRLVSEPLAATRPVVEERAVAAAAGSVAEPPDPSPSIERADFQLDKAAAAPRQEPLRAPASPRRRSPSHESGHQALAKGKSSVVETLSVSAQATTPSDSAEAPAAVTRVEQVTTRRDSAEAAIAVTRVAANPSPAAWESEAREDTRKVDRRVQNEPSELALVKRIHGELREESFSTVLRLCAEHERLWPHGMFELERQGARAIALCGARTADAGRHASQFLAAHPQVPVAMRVKTACASQLPKP